MKKFGCLALLVVLLFGGYGIYRALNPPRPPSFAELPPAEQQKRREAAQDLVQQVESVAQAAKKRENRAFTLTASEEQLNTLVQDRLRMQNLPVSDLSVSLEPATLILSGTAKYQGLNVPVEMRGSLSAQGGGVAYDIDSLKLGGLPAPEDWKNQAQKAISDGLSKALRGEKGAKIEEVEVRDDSLTVSGRTG